MAVTRKAKKWPTHVLRGLAIFWLAVFLLWLAMALWSSAQIHGIFQGMQQRTRTPASAPATPTVP
jgi:hypothetical protein